MDIPSSTSDRMLDDSELERQDAAFGSAGRASIDPDPDVALARGECPFCDDYHGEYPGRHASAAHPDRWSEYKDE